MKLKLSPALIGLITGIVMIVIVMVTYSARLSEESPLQYLVFIAYAAGIVWAILFYTRSDLYSGGFWNAFNPGLRCFVTVILLMVAFTIIFNKMHPEFTTESAALYRDMLVKGKGKTPAQMDEMVDGFKSGYLTMLVYRSIFGYLIIGALVTAITAAITSRRK
ncbi:MAG TPA: DUF4199 domain-containing protein [Chitinophagaceae bacterium]|jgi:hypothetical protein|nr:DUF4199 domain-containing protein [Chitinophagaceae bacterium]